MELHPASCGPEGSGGASEERKAPSQRASQQALLPVSVSSLCQGRLGQGRDRAPSWVARLPGLIQSCRPTFSQHARLGAALVRQKEGGGGCPGASPCCRNCYATVNAPITPDWAQDQLALYTPRLRRK